MADNTHHSGPAHPDHWNPEVPEWPSYQSHRPRAGWDDRRMVLNLLKVLGGVVLILGILFIIALVVAGGWDRDATFWNIRPAESLQTTGVSAAVGDTAKR